MKNDAEDKLAKLPAQSFSGQLAAAPLRASIKTKAQEAKKWERWGAAAQASVQESRRRPGLDPGTGQGVTSPLLETEPLSPSQHGIGIGMQTTPGDTHGSLLPQNCESPGIFKEYRHAVPHSVWN